MQIEWGVVATQALGFIIVMMILRKYAWGTLMDFLEERRQKIANDFAEAAATKKQADDLREEYDRQLADIENTKRLHIQEAAQEANKLATDIKDEARREASAARLKVQQDIERDMDKANATLRDNMVTSVVSATEKLIRERLDSDKHKQLINQFLDEMNVKESG